jgi:hypothetical protein
VAVVNHRLLFCCQLRHAAPKKSGADDNKKPANIAVAGLFECCCKRFSEQIRTYRWQMLPFPQPVCAPVQGNKTGLWV